MLVPNAYEHTHVVSSKKETDFTHPHPLPLPLPLPLPQPTRGVSGGERERPVGKMAEDGGINKVVGKFSQLVIGAEREESVLLRLHLQHDLKRHFLAHAVCHFLFRINVWY